MSATRRTRAGKPATPSERERAREANRIHCKETRDRRRERERQLGEVGGVLRGWMDAITVGPGQRGMCRAW